MTTSTFRDGSPETCKSMTGAGAGACARTTSMSSVSMSTLQALSNSWASLRFRTRRRTGLSGFGKRTDSWKVRCIDCASAVCCHSWKIDE